MKNTIQCKVLVLLSTYNGEKYLEEQLQSLFAQQNVYIDIFVRDDGSSDRTREILDEYKALGKLDWYTGENLRPAKSFMDLIYKADSEKYDFFAFCDQDDYWLENKLAIAVDKILSFGDSKPSLYYGRPRLVDKDLNQLIQPKGTLQCMTDFYSSLITPNATGCTFVFNKALLKLLQTSQPEYIAMHDGWVHKVCTACNGNVFFDEDVPILYRQHGSNVIGVSTSNSKIFFRRLKSGFYRDCVRSRTNKSLLDCYSNYIDKEKLYYLDLSANYKESFAKKIKLLFCPKIRTNYFKRNLLFKLAVLFRAF